MGSREGKLYAIHTITSDEIGIETLPIKEIIYEIQQLIVIVRIFLNKTFMTFRLNKLHRRQIPPTAC